MSRELGILFDGLGSDQPMGLSVSPTGSLSTVEGMQSVRQSLMILLSTAPGERVMRPDYGCPLHRLVFMPNDETTAGLAIHYVRRAIIAFEPRAEILGIDATTDAENTLSVEVEYRVRKTGENDQLNVTLDLAGD